MPICRNSNPSDGLEPPTASLPSSNEAGTAGKRGKPRAQKPAKRRDQTKTTDASLTRAVGLAFPQCSLHGDELSVGADHTARVLRAL